MKNPLCLMDGCTADRYSRGLCQRDYESLYAAVKSGKTTWAKAETKGLCLPSKYVRRLHQFLDEDTEDTGEQE